MKIVLFATPEFAIPTLNKIYNSKHEIVAVYTREPKEQGRGMKLQNTPIHEEALKLGLQVYTTKSLRKSEEWEKLKSFNADIFVVVAYGLILPKEILNIAKFGCINIHPSLLPRWRGASPLQRALMNGDKKTGVCIIVLGEGLDDGDILACKEIEITNTTTLEDLHDKLSVDGANLMLECLDNIEKTGKVIGRPQGEEGLIYAKKIEKEEGKIDFNNSIEQIDLLIRTLASTVGTYFEYNGERIKVLKAEFSKNNPDNFKNGDVIDKSNFSIKCNNGIIKPLILQREGKKALEIGEFLRGFSKIR
ncbi:MAG TPA: methionyl-tRNA formyltransferase [Rickettsiales bacterium]|nr:methionyl-tRNA formyltransferase [Rickettsiales bacterium]